MNQRGNKHLPYVSLCCSIPLAGEAPEDKTNT